MSTATVMPERLARFLRDDFHLRSGVGRGVNSHADVCVVQAADWLAGASGDDAAPCVPPTIRRYLIRLNDSRLFALCRDRLKPYAPRVVGLDRSPEVEASRGFVAVDHAARVFAPTWLRALGREDWAVTLGSIAPIVDRDSAILAMAAARGIRKAAYAACAEDAVVITDGVADAAGAASEGFPVDIYVYTVSYAVSYASDATDASDAADVFRAMSLECLEAMIAVA